MSNHTPGPWTYTEYGHICAGPQIIGNAYQFEEDDSYDDELPYIPNARLMAAAPEMKEKLDEMAEFLRIVWVCIPEEIADTCARQIADWEILKAKIEGDESNTGV